MSSRLPARLTAALSIALAVPAMTACTFTANANFTESPEAIATLAEDTLEQQIGQRPDIDCGDEQVDVVEGNEITCILTDPANGTQYDTAITFTLVEGTRYEIDIQVADTPN